MIQFSSNVEAINLQLREHQQSVGDWDLAPFVKEIHRWVEIFDLEFKLQITCPVIVIDKLRREVDGCFRLGRSGFGTKDTISINEIYLNRDFVELLGTVLHEMIHEWQQYYGKSSKSRWYHNKEYRNKAHECGLVVDEYGRDIDYTHVFYDTLSKYGVNIPSLPQKQDKFRRNGSKLKKWSCSCRPPINIRCAVRLDATCNRCHSKFRLMDGAVIKTLPLNASTFKREEDDNGHHIDSTAQEIQLLSGGSSLDAVIPSQAIDDLVVALGSKVKVKYGGDHEIVEFCIVEEHLRDNVSNISVNCPLARVILGHRVGDEVRLAIEGKGERLVKIVSIELPKKEDMCHVTNTDLDEDSPVANTNVATRGSVVLTTDKTKLTPIISASRRTDLPRFYPDYLAERLNPCKRNSIVVLWTKDPKNIFDHAALRAALSQHYPVAMVTITGMGGSAIEPGVPPWQEVMENTKKLINFLGSPEKVRIRFDPLMYLEDGYTNVELFPEVARAAGELGVKHIITSFVTFYPQVKKGLEESGIKLIDPPLSRKLTDLKILLDQASKLGITLYSCSSLRIDSIREAACISADWLTNLFPVMLDTRKDPTQRKNCNCIVSRDIGSYSQTCFSGCGYCYAQRGGTMRYLRNMSTEAAKVVQE